MRKRLSITIALSVLCIFAVVFVVWAQAHKLRYQGQNLQTWALQLNSPQPGAPAAANAAFKAMGPEAVPGLVDLLEAKDPGVRRRVWALATHLPRKLRAAFFRDIKWPDSTEVQAAAAKALGLIGPDARGSIPALADALRDPSRQVSLESAVALSRIGPTSVPVLMEALEDKDANVRHMAAYALGEIGPNARAAVPQLVRMLGETNEALRASVAYSLSRIGPGDFTTLIDVLENGNNLAREQAAKVLLLYYGSLRQALPALVKLAQDKSSTLRQQALETSRAVREADVMALGLAFQALKDPSAEVRLAGIQALQGVLIPAQAMVRPLTERLKDESSAVRAAAARTLATLGPAAKSAVPSLSAALEDNDETVRTAAREALRLVQCTAAVSDH